MAQSAMQGMAGQASATGGAGGGKPQLGTAQLPGAMTGGAQPQTAMSTQASPGASMNAAPAAPQGQGKPQPGAAQLPAGMPKRVAASGLANQWGRGPTIGGGKSGMDKLFNAGRLNTDILSGGVTKVPDLL